MFGQSGPGLFDLRWRMFGIPVRIQVSFWFFCVLIGLHYLQRQEWVKFFAVVVAVLLPCLFLGLPFDRRKPRLRLISLCFLAFLASGIVGCSGKYPSSTPPGTYSILIKGHGQSSALDRTTAITLIVTPKETQ